MHSFTTARVLKLLLYVCKNTCEQSTKIRIKKLIKTAKTWEKLLPQESNFSPHFPPNCPGKTPRNTSKKQQEANAWSLVHTAQTLLSANEFFNLKNRFLKTSENRLFFLFKKMMRFHWISLPLSGQGRSFIGCGTLTSTSNRSWPCLMADMMPKSWSR